MHRDQTIGRGHLGVLADATEVPGVAQPHHGDAEFGATLDAQLDCGRPDGLSHAVLAVYQQQRAGVDQHLDLLVGELNAVGQQIHVQRRTDHAVAVVARQVGAHETATDALRFGIGARSVAEDLGDEAGETVMVDHHVAVRSVVGCAGLAHRRSVRRSPGSFPHRSTAMQPADLTPALSRRST